MEIFLGGLFLTLAVVLFLLVPILQGKEAPLHRDEDEPTEAEASRRVALLALRDVEYDYATGKLNDEDYRRLKGQLAHDALGALRAEEKGEGDEPLEEEIAALRRQIREGALCARCGRANPARSRFCGGCGLPLTSGEGDG